MHVVQACQWTVKTQSKVFWLHSPVYVDSKNNPLFTKPLAVVQQTRKRDILHGRCTDLLWTFTKDYRIPYILKRLCLYLVAAENYTTEERFDDWKWRCMRHHLGTQKTLERVAAALKKCRTECYVNLHLLCMQLF